MALCFGRVATASLALAIVVASCGPGTSTPGTGQSALPRIFLADVGGYHLAFECAGSGSGGPTVILEAGYTASGIDTFGRTILPALASRMRVCTYDRAGDGLSDARPARVRPLTVATQAKELHALLAAIRAGPPYVLVGHSYGGMVIREFAGLYPDEVAGMVLIDASSEPEIPVYERLHAGPWTDGSVSPAPNQRIDIHASVRELEGTPRLGSMPLIVITAGILEDPWLKTAPQLEAKAQARLAGLSTDAIHLMDRGKGHFIPKTDPRIVIVAIEAVVSSVADRSALPPCADVFNSVLTGDCLRPGELGHQQT
jgi:pimeloyl-ACP methyl ester carboxylesterase